MQIVIDIPEDRYDEIHSLKFVMYGLQSEENRKLFNRLINAVQDGTVLSKHGRLGDLDYLYKKFEANGCKDSNVYRLIKDEPTILEVTKE